MGSVILLHHSRYCKQHNMPCYKYAGRRRGSHACVVTSAVDGGCPRKRRGNRENYLGKRHSIWRNHPHENLPSTRARTFQNRVVTKPPFPKERFCVVCVSVTPVLFNMGRDDREGSDYGTMMTTPNPSSNDVVSTKRSEATSREVRRKRSIVNMHHR